MDFRPHPIIQALSDPTKRTDRTVTLDDVALELRYSPEPGVDLCIRASDPNAPADVVVSTGFEAAAQRPASYPPELPYLPGLKVSVQALPDGRTALVLATWWMVDDADAALAEILAQSAAAGWTEAAGPCTVPIPGIRTLTLHRPDHQREISIVTLEAHAMIQLIDSRADA